MNTTSKPITVTQLVAMKGRGQRICMLTAYDYAMARILDDAGVHVVLVGDSLGMVVQGHETTLPVTLNHMIYHGTIVRRAVRRALLVVDLPFPVNHLGVRRTVSAAARVMKQTQCQAVKLEGGAQQAEVIDALVTAGIPVMAHVGLRPQAVHVMGGYRVQRDAQRLLEDARAAQDAGAFSVVLECIPSAIAAEISRSLRIPTIGIGAGPHCDGQVLVLYDMLGLTSGYVPKFVKSYANMAELVGGAVRQWCDEVSEGTFPDSEHQFE